MKDFFADLQGLGLLGYESHHARFLVVLDRVPDNEVFSQAIFL